MESNTSNVLVLPTLPKLLRYRFSLVRKALAGTSVEIKPAATEVVAKKAAAKTSSAIFSRVAATSKAILDKVAVAAIVLAFTIGLILLIPQAYYALTPVDTVPVAATQDGTVLGGSFEEGTQIKEETRYVPPQDETLPEGEWLVIPRIGVRTPLHETVDSEEALFQGVWKVPGYGEAGSIDAPVILAAHRFGWEWWWQSDYWKYNSFYLLPDTEPGDLIEVISDQRKWTYEIYGGAEGDAIADYDADLILYTCKFLNSPVRHFRYARLLDPTVDSQK